MPECFLKAACPWISDLPEDAVGIQEKTMGGLQGSPYGEGWFLGGGVTRSSLSSGGPPVATAGSGFPTFLQQPVGTVAILGSPRGSRI